MELPEVDGAEITYLILQFLNSVNCSGTAELLLKEAESQCLLPTRTDIFGCEHSMSHEEIRACFEHVPPGQLSTILKHHLQALQSSSNLLRGVGTVLGAGLHDALSKHEAKRKNAQPAAPSTLPDKVLSRRLFGYCPARGLPREDAVRIHIDSLKHLKTIRGHRVPVYCLAFDRSGRWLISGSDDRLVKIWSMQTGLLQMACRGHSGEITDLAISCDNTLVASSSNDRTARVWDLEESNLGCPISALLGHGHVISFIDFHPIVPSVLVSSSLDGTCRIWDARRGGQAVHVLGVGPDFGPARQLSRSVHAFPRLNPPVDTAAPASTAEAAQADGTPAEELADEQGGDEAVPDVTGLLVCSFSPDGTYLVAGTNDCACYVWTWAEFRKSEDASTKEGFIPSCLIVQGLMEQWTEAPKPLELCPLIGHNHDVLLLQFSHDGHGIATGSRDGTLRVWRRPIRRGQPARGVWLPKLVLSLPVDEAEAAQARRRRRSLPVQSITQLAWTKNDCLVLAAISTAQIAVWDACTGEEKHRLSSHIKSVHILQPHPTLYNVVMSASYDGQTIIWDLTTGLPLKIFDSRATRPGGGRWADPFHLMDGQWTVDGLGIVVSDSAGQVHIYGVGSDQLYARARYDQFVDGEARALQQDSNGDVIDIVKQLPPHLTFLTDRLCDVLMEPYSQEYQDAWRSGTLWRLSVRDAQLNANGTDQMPPALLAIPPVVTSAIWAGQENDLDEFGLQVEVERALRRQNIFDEESSQPQQQQPLPQQQPAPAEPVAAATNEADGPQPEPPVPAPGVSTRRRDRQMGAAQQGDEAADGRNFFDDGFDEVVGAENMTRSERLALRNRRREEEFEREQRRWGRLRRREAEREAGRSERRKRKRSRRLPKCTEDEASETDEDDLFELKETSPGVQDEEEQPRRLRSRGSSRAADQEGSDSELVPMPQRRGRPAKAYAWLQASIHRPGVYVPQLGDAVVYIWVGHKQYMEITNDKTPGPWVTLQTPGESGVPLRAAEPCTVISLTYRMADDQMANTYAVVKLQFTEEANEGLRGRKFDVDIPPSHLGQAEFVILRQRYNAAVRHNFEIGCRGKIFYPDEDSGGRWYYGWALNDSLDARIRPDSPNFEHAMWERFEISWDEGDPALASAAAPNRSLNPRADRELIVTSHAAWEIFDPMLSHFATICENGRMDEDLGCKLAEAIDLCMAKLRFQPFNAEPQPGDRFYISRQRGMQYYNRIVELPMSLGIIAKRIADHYYRQVAAVRHDLGLLISNAAAFNGEESEITNTATRLVSILYEVLDGEKQPGDMFLPEDEAAEEDEAADGPNSALAARRTRRRRRVVFEDEDSSSEDEQADEPTALATQRRSMRLQEGSTDPSSRAEEEQSACQQEPLLQVRPRRDRQQVRRYSPEAGAGHGQLLHRPTTGMSLRSRTEAGAVIAAEPDDEEASDRQFRSSICTRARRAQPVQDLPESEQRPEPAPSRRPSLRIRMAARSRSLESERESPDQEPESPSFHGHSSDEEARSRRHSRRHHARTRSSRHDRSKEAIEDTPSRKIQVRLRRQRAPARSTGSTAPQDEIFRARGSSDIEISADDNSTHPHATSREARAESPALADMPEEAEELKRGGQSGRRSRRLVAVTTEQDEAADAVEAPRVTRASNRNREDSSRPGLRKRKRPSYREIEDENSDDE